MKGLPVFVLGHLSLDDHSHFSDMSSMASPSYHFLLPKCLTTGNWLTGGDVDFFRSSTPLKVFQVEIR